MILSAGCWLAAGATVFAPLDAGTARARVAGAVLVLPRTCAFPEFRRGFDLRMPLGRVAMIWERQSRSRRPVAHHIVSTYLVQRLVHCSNSCPKLTMG